MVGYPHDIKGQGIYAYVTLMTGEQPSEELRKELVQWVRKEIGPIASPDLIQFAPGLPKTRSGKIMRRILRKIAEDEFGSSRRHLDAGRSGRGRRPGEEPAEQEGRREGRRSAWLRRLAIQPCAPIAAPESRHDVCLKTGHVRGEPAGAAKPLSRLQNHG